MSFLERVDQTIRRSPVWRSLFRNPYPDDERSRAYAVMNNVFLHLHPVRVRQHAVKFAYTFCLGGLSFFLFLVLTVTGVYLMFFYIPSETQAYTNILDIQSRVTFRDVPSRATTFSDMSSPCPPRRTPGRGPGPTGPAFVTHGP